MHRVNIIAEYGNKAEKDIEITVGSLLLVQQDSGSISTIALQPYLITTSNYVKKITASYGSNIAYALLIKNREDVFITVASDHTDPDAERCSVISGKHTYPKVIARRAWSLENIEDHWDLIELRNMAIINDEKKMAQQFTGRELPQPSIVLEMIEDTVEEPRNMVIIVERRIMPEEYVVSNYYELSIIDNSNKRSIEHYYWVD
ncbi:DUF2848 domain-containing protein [Caldivirga sp. UBA161]|uniref:DUF2848 domain-containing protein n=1 Tax=Caldivirga sp. UBA161 TaxID=1915569 RepID=UPI0025BB5019|nr:DUF2848 domain-containing protein [Caldivirga sp. UBA161]